MKRRSRISLQLAILVVILMSSVSPTVASRTQRDLPNSKNGFDSDQFYIDSPSPYTVSPLTDSSTGSAKSQIQAKVSVARFSGITQDDAGDLFVGDPGYTLLSFTLSNQKAGDYIVGVAVASSANGPTLQNAGYMVEGSPSGAAVYSVPAMQNGLAFLANDPNDPNQPFNTQYPCDTFSSSCIVDAASAIDGADGSVSFWPMGPQSPLDTQPLAPSLTQADVLLAGFPDESALTTSGLTFSSQTVLNRLSFGPGTFAVLVYDSTLGRVVTLGGLSLSQCSATPCRSTSQTFQIPSASYSEIIDVTNASGTVQPVYEDTEPIDDSLTDCMAIPAARTVTYSYQSGPTAETVSIDTSGSRYDTVLQVTAGGKPVACNDDFLDASNILHSQAKLPAVSLTPNTTYLITVGEYPPVQVNVDPTFAPPYGSPDTPTYTPLSSNPILHFSIAPLVVQTPTFSVPAGTYTSTSVSISDSTPGAVIYYTTNGTTPTTSSTVYSTPITLSNGGTHTIKAIAVASGYTNSAVAVSTYIIKPVLHVPAFSVPGGTYSTPQTVTISDISNVPLYYTTDGSMPTTGSTLYTGAITVSSSETINAIAAATGYTNSPVATATYTIAP